MKLIKNIGEELSPNSSYTRPDLERVEFPIEHGFAYSLESDMESASGWGNQETIL